MLLVNASFVGGLGSARKVLSFTKALKEKNISYKLVTDSDFAKKLGLMGVAYDFVIPFSKDDSNQNKYDNVSKTLSNVNYDAMISFGWRTFVPHDATTKGIPCAIIDSGWPEELQELPGEFAFNVYTKLQTYCLTTHFYTSEMDSFLPKEIKFDWVAQPFSNEEINWHIEIGNSRLQLRKELSTEFPELATNKRIVFLYMHPEYITTSHLVSNGGFIAENQANECLKFLAKLVTELDTTDSILFLHKDLSTKIQNEIDKCKNLQIVNVPNLDPKKHHILKCCSDITLARAMRDVGSTQTALSGQPTLHTICPIHNNYMGEWESAIIAEKLGIAKPVNYEIDNLKKVIEIGLDKKITEHAQEISKKFCEERGVNYLLRKLGVN